MMMQKIDVKLRYLTEITHYNVAASKELMTIVDGVRHLDGIKGNFMLSEKEYLALVILFEKGKVASDLICSNVKEILDQTTICSIHFGTRQFRCSGG
jgi:hypothetical protein